MPHSCFYSLKIALFLVDLFCILRVDERIQNFLANIDFNLVLLFC